MSGNNGNDFVFGDVGFDQCFGNSGVDADVLWMGGGATCQSQNGVEACINLLQRCALVAAAAYYLTRSPNPRASIGMRRSVPPPAT